MQEQYLLITIIGGISCLMIIEVLYIWKIKKRIIELENALGPKELMSIEESKLPSRIHKEILASLEWLRSIRYRIPTMDTITLETMKDELKETHEMYCDAFGEDLMKKVTSHSGAQLKQALLLHIEIAIGLVEREIAAKTH